MFPLSFHQLKPKSVLPTVPLRSCLVTHFYDLLSLQLVYSFLKVLYLKKKEKRCLPSPSPSRINAFWACLWLSPDTFHSDIHRFYPTAVLLHSVCSHLPLSSSNILQNPLQPRSSRTSYSIDGAYAFDFPSLHMVHCISLSWHSPCRFGDAFPIYWRHYGFGRCHLNGLQPFP